MSWSRSDLAGKAAVVTGGGSGLGAALVRELAGAGMDVAVLDIDETTAAEVAASVAEDTDVRTIAVRADVGDGDSVVAAAAAVEDGLGGCDVLCANVGVQQFGAIDRLTEADWSWVLDVNVVGTVRTVAAFLPLLRGRDGFRQIMLTSSSSALVPGVRLAAYQTSKFAVVGFGETLRQELSDEGIGVSILFPAGMATRHLESSAQAKPADKGEWVLDPADLEALMATPGIGDDPIATPEHAVRNVLDDLLADQPYILTHGTYRQTWRERVALLEDAFDRMERS